MSLATGFAKKVSPLGLILLVGVGLRLWGINFGLPYTYAPDEPTYLSIALKMLQTGDLNPRWWYYPTLMFYLNAAVLGLYFIAGYFAGRFVSPADLQWPEIIAMGVGKTTLPAEFLVARGLTALFSVGAIVMVYWIARRLHPSRWVALIAATLFAVSPTVVEHSQRIGPDIFALFFSLVTFLFALRIVDAPKIKNYLWAGVCAGLAIACKYNAGLILVAVVAAHFLQFGSAGWRRKELFIALGAAGAAFLLATPFAALDFPAFWDGVRFQALSYTMEGHVGQEGNAFQWYVTYLAQTESVAMALGAIGGIWFLFARSKPRLVLLSFPLVYFLFVSQLLTRNARTIMLIIPYLDLVAALVVVSLYQWLMNARVPRRLFAAGVLALGGLMIALPLHTTVAADLRLTQPDGRATARAWLDANLPPGARVAQEAYTPYVDPRRFVVQGVNSIVDNAPDWYVRNGFEYLVLSEGMYGRFFAEPERYADWVAQYDDFFARFKQIARFDDNNYEVRVYQTDVALPAHRVAARFGDYGELIELVGYDDVKWKQGEPLRLRLFWRTVGTKPEPLEVELRLLGQADQELARARSDLFQGQGWRMGMFDGEFALPVPADVPPDVYRVQVIVIWTRYAYPLPAFNWTEQKIDPVLLQPIELK